MFLSKYLHFFVPGRKSQWTCSEISSENFVSQKLGEKSESEKCPGGLRLVLRAITKTQHLVLEAFLTLLATGWIACLIRADGHGAEVMSIRVRMFKHKQTRFSFLSLMLKS